MSTGKHPIYLVEVRSQYLMCATFLRFQEHYESPKFRGKVFDLEEFMDWYVTTRDGTFSYFEDWAGFNFPSRILKPFREGLFDPLSRKEKILLSLFEHIPEPFYVIGAKNPLDPMTVKHEFVHGLFCTDAVYRRKVLDAVAVLDIEGFWEALEAMGYCKEVLEDEINAYATTGARALSKRGVERQKIAAASEALRAVFLEHYGYSIENAEGRDVLKHIHRLDL